MNNIPPLKGLTAQDRVNWDKSYKDYLLKQGKTEDEIDKYYVAYHFKKKFGDELSNQIVDVNERINYYNNAVKPVNNSKVQSGASKQDIYKQLEQNLYNTNSEYRNLKDANYRLSASQQNKLSKYTRELNQQSQQEYDNLYPTSQEKVVLNPWDNGTRPIDVLGINKAVQQQEAYKTWQTIHEAKDKEQKAIAAKDRETRLSNWRKEYLKAHENEAQELSNLTLGNPEDRALSFSQHSSRLSDEANKYAEDKEFHYQLDNTIIPIEQNNYASINNKEDLRNRILELSSIYYEFRNSDWLNKGEAKIDWNELYNLVSSDLKDGHIDRAKYTIDEYISDNVIGKNQETWNTDNMGHHGKINSAVRQATAGAIQSFTEAATFIPSFTVGAIQALVNINDLQLMGGMNYWSRLVDNTIHNDWLLGLSNTALADWADELTENADIYGTGFGNTLLRGAYTYGAMAGTLADALVTRGLGSAFKPLGKNAVKSVERAAKRQIIGQGLRAKENVIYNKALSGTMQLKANYSEAVQQALETERSIYKNANEQKYSTIRDIVDSELSTRLDVDYLPYTEEDIEYAISQRTPEVQQYWQDLKEGKNAIPPEGYDAINDHTNILLEAKAKNLFDKRVPGYDDQVSLAAHIESGTETQLATGLLLLGDIAFGGVDKALVNFALGKKALNFSNLGQRINTKGGFGKWATSKDTWKGIGLAGLRQAKTAGVEVLTEMGQQSISALGQQFGDFTAESFLMNHLYGDGSAILGSTSYRYLSELDPEEFSRDAALGETVKQTLITTMLMPNIGHSGKIRPTKRREGQSWLSNTIQQAHYYLPINTQLGNSVFNELSQYGQASAFATAINKYYNNPSNRAATTGTTATINYAIQMMADIANNDQTSFENHQTSKSIAEGIALSLIEGNELVNTHRQVIRNMADIKSANDEQKQKAIQDFREESKGNPAMTTMSDEEILNVLEEAGKRINHIYDRVFEEQAKLDEKYGRDRSNWQRRSAIIFDIIAQEELNTRIADKKKTIDEFANSLSEEDLGESRQSVQEINKSGKLSPSTLVLSGQDILRLEPELIEFVLNPKNRKKFSKEQQDIINKLSDVLLEKDSDNNILDTIHRWSTERAQNEKLKIEYRKILKDENWTSKKIEKKAKEVINEFSPDKKARNLQQAAINTKSVSELRNLYLREVEANTTRQENQQYDILDALRSIKDPETKKKVDELFKIERISNSIKAAIDRTTLTDDIKDNLINQVDRIASEALNSSDVSDISKYNIPITADGQDLSGVLNDILQTATQNASNTQTVESEPVKPVQSSDDLPKPTDLGDRDVDTAIPVNDNPLKKYTKDEARNKLQELDNLLIEAYTAENSHQHDTILVKVMALRDDLEKRLPEGWGISKVPDYKLHTEKGDFLVFKLYDLPTETKEQKPQTEDKKDDITDINNRKEESKQPIDRDGITKVAEILFEKEGRVYSYPIRDEDVQLGDGVNGPFSGTGRVVNIRDVQDDAEAEFLIYQTDKKGNFKTNNKGERIKRERPQFIDRHSQIQSNSAEEQVIYEDDETRNSISTETKDGITTTKVITFRKDKNKNTTFGATPINSDVVAPEYRETYETEDVEKVEYYIEEVREDSNGNIGGTIGVKITYKDGTTSTTSHIAAKLNYNPFKQQTATPPTNRHSQTQTQVDKQEQGKVVLNLDGVSRKGTPYTSRYIQTIDDSGFIHIKHEGTPAFKKVKSSDLQSSLDDLIGKREDFQTEEAYNEVLEDAQGKGLSIVQITIRPDNTVSIQTNNGITIEGNAAKEILNKYFYNQQSPTSPTENPPITGSTGGRYSNRTEYQQSVVDNNITPAVTELDGTALSKGLFEPNKATGQPNIMRQLQEEGAFDYINKGALTEGDEIEFIATQEQMPDGSTQVVIWEVTEPKDGEERTNPKWHGKQLLNVLDQTEVEGKRKELINRIRKAYEEAGRPESYLYTNEKFIVNNIGYSTIPFRQTNPTEASSEETIETTNLQKGLVKKNGVWGISFFNKAKGKMVHVPVIFRQAKKDKSGATRILFSDSRMKSKTINIRKTAVGGTGEMNTVSMVLPTPNGFVSVNSVYILTRNLSNSIDKYKESFSKGSVGKTLIEKIKSHLNDIKTVTAFSDYLGFRRGFSEYIYNDRNHGRIDLGYRGSTGNTVLISAIPHNDKYVLVDPTDARNIINDNNGQGFTLDEVCKEYLTQLIDNPEADVTMRLNMEAIENKPEIITDLIDDGLLWAPDSLNARFTAANTQFSCSLDSKAESSKPKQEAPKSEVKQTKETIKPAPVASSSNPSSTIEPVKKTQPKVDDSVELGSKVKRRKLKAGQSVQSKPEVPTTPKVERVTTPTAIPNKGSFDTLSEKDKQHVLTKVTKEEWDNLTKEEQDNILNC